MLPEEDALLILKFEPILNSTANRKRTLFKMERQHINTMQVSDKKKQRFLRNLYEEICAGTFKKKL
jgi:aspartate/glutamate racemase